MNRMKNEDRRTGQTEWLLDLLIKEVALGNPRIILIAHDRRYAMELLRKVELALIHRIDCPSIPISRGQDRVFIGHAQAQTVIAMTCWELDQRARGMRASMFWDGEASRQFEEMNRIPVQDYMP